MIQVLADQGLPGYDEHPGSPEKPVRILILGFENFQISLIDILERFRPNRYLKPMFEQSVRKLQERPNEICRYFGSKDVDGNLQFGLIFVRLQEPIETTIQCLSRVVMKAVGFEGKLGVAGMNSLQSPGFNGSDLADIDRLLINLLYDKSLWPGMAFNEVKGAFSGVYARHRPEPRPLPMDRHDLLDPVDEPTVACIACARILFLAMAVTGSEHEPRNLDNRRIGKARAVQRY